MKESTPFAPSGFAYILWKWKTKEAVTSLMLYAISVLRTQDFICLHCNQREPLLLKLFKRKETKPSQL